MCRSIKNLRKQEPPVTREDITAASLQFVRKVSGYQTPSGANREAFQTAVSEIAAASEKLLSSLQTR